MVEHAAADNIDDHRVSSAAAAVRYVDISSGRARAQSMDTENLQPTTQKKNGPLPSLKLTKKASHASDSDSLQASAENDQQREPSLILTSSGQSLVDPIRTYIANIMDEMREEQEAQNPSVPTVSEELHMDDGPLVAGKRVDGLFTRRHAALFLSTLFSGVLTSCLKRGVLPIMKSELQMQAYQADAAEVLVMTPWSCMFVMGFLSDCVPIFGLHRKAYIVIGWMLTSTALFTMAFVNYTHEYNAISNHTKPGPASTSMINGNLFLLGCASFGGILTVIIVEAYFIALSKRERRRERGQLIGSLLMTQFFAECGGQILTDFVVFNITDVGVQPLFTLREIVIFLSALALIPVGVVAAFFQEDTELTLSLTSARYYSAHTPKLRRILDSMQRHAAFVWLTLERVSTWHVVRFLACFVFFSEFSIRFAHVILDEVSGVTLKTASSGKIVAETFTFFAAYFWRLAFLNTNWIWLMGVSYLCVLWLPQALYFQLVAFGVVQDTAIYVVVSSCQAYIRGLIIVLLAAMVIEIAPHGAEGATLGLVASITTIMRLVATTLSNAVGFAFDAQAIQEDGIKSVLYTNNNNNVLKPKPNTATMLTESVRNKVVAALLVCYVIKLLACSGFVFLPTQKQHIQSLHRLGQPSVRYAQWTLALLATSLLVSATFNALVVTPATSCMKVFGGGGCKKNE